jgi:hypothetical protein
LYSSKQYYSSYIIICNMGSVECNFRVLDVAVIGGGIGMLSLDPQSDYLTNANHRRAMRCNLTQKIRAQSHHLRTSGLCRRSGSFDQLRSEWHKMATRMGCQHTYGAASYP